MKSFLVLFSLLCLIYDVKGHGRLCGNSSLIKSRSCSTQILGDGEENKDTCKVETIPPNSSACRDMEFGPIESNNYIGSVSLTPYILNYKYVDQHGGFNQNITVLNITFSNIKWKTMKFRFQRQKNIGPRNHCSSIEISQDVAVSDQSVLYYDCYWSAIDRNYAGEDHVLDFEAMTDGREVNRGRYLFNIPSETMLSPEITVEEWKPFTYIEVHANKLRLHILPPPKDIGVNAYQIAVKKVLSECEKGTQCIETVSNTTLKMKNSTQEKVYEYNWTSLSGSCYFVVTPLHTGCVNGDVKCQRVESPRVFISSELHHHQALNICIASVTALIVATLFAYYIVLRVIRKYWCKDYKAMAKEIPIPPRILVVYSATNKLHAECISSFVNYLRSEYGFDVMFDADISNTTHSDPYLWAEEAFNLATHIIYVPGPKTDLNTFNNIYNQPIITPHKDVDLLLLSLIKTNCLSKLPKDVINVQFEHSTKELPIETRREKVFVLLKDWQKLISYLSKNMLPKQQMMRTEKGRCFLEDLKRAKSLLGKDEMVVKCEKVRINPFEKKVLL